MKEIKYEHLLFVAIAKNFKKNKYKSASFFFGTHISIVNESTIYYIYIW